MFKKFTDGLVFGAGFAITFMAIWYIAAYTLYPKFISSIAQTTDRQLSHNGPNVPSDFPNSETKPAPSKPFHELSPEEQIKKASVIALAKYEKSPDGKMKAIIKEFLKKDPGVVIYYNTGDEHPSSSYYPSVNRAYGDGIIIFFTGSPARMELSTTFTDHRIGGLSDIPVELFRKKCKEPNA